MKKMIQLAILFLLFACSHAFALDLQDAKDQGLVGETPGGYLEAVSAPSAEVKQLVDTINEKRKQHYRKIAESNSTELTTVEKLAGEKAIEKSRSGHFIKLGGQWRQK